MKKNFKSMLWLCVIAALLCAMLSLAACGKTDGDKATYEVTVLTPDNAPAAGAKVSFVEIEDGKTHDAVSVSVNAQGVASYTSEGGNDVNATLSDLPAGYAAPDGQDTLRLTKNSPKATVILRSLSEALPDLEYSQPLSGEGTAKYVNGDSGQLEYNSFKPYVVEEGNYKFAIESANQKIYLQFESRSSEAGLYLVYSRGDADVSVQMLTGSTIGGIFNPGAMARDNDDRPQFNDNRALADKNFELEFSNNESVTMGYMIDGVFYFEIALKNAADVGKYFAVTFEKSDKPYVPKPPTVYTDVHADPALAKAPEGQGTLRTIPTNCANFAVVRADDGTYHLGNETGATLYANLDGPWPLGATLQDGSPMTCILRTFGGTNPYKWTQDTVTGENWLPFIAEYVGYLVDSDGTLVAPGATNENTGVTNNNVSKCNSDGYYPVNDQIVRFLTLLQSDIEIQNFYFTPDNYMGSTWFLPKGYEWIFLCGYYGDEYAGEDFGGSGTQQDPYTVRRAGEYELSIPAGGKLYFLTPLPYEVSSRTAGAILEADGKTFGEDGGGFEHSVSGETTFCVYLKDGKAGSIILTISDVQSGDGSIGDPYQLDSLAGEYSVKAAAGKEIWYTFISCAGAYSVSANSGDITVEIYDLEGYIALMSGSEADPIASIAGKDGALDGQFEIDENQYYIVVRCAASADVALTITKTA